MILAGDIGGTKTVLALYREDGDGAPGLDREQTFASADFEKFESILDEFLAGGVRVSAACFGVAGPVVERRCQTTNLPWVLDADALSARLETPRVRLLNDLEAAALGMLHFGEEDLLELNPNARPQAGNIAVVAAGTGLGEAILYWDGERHRAIATEGGHSDFAPQNTLQDRLLGSLRTKYGGHVSCERILCGDGFGLIYDFLCENGYGTPSPEVAARGDARLGGIDRNAQISRLGVENRDPLCRETVKIFAELYGAETGNLALKCLSVGGVFIGGGIGPKIR
ncbi:MAG: glucokinase, partial [Gammaproteobacteria bacterium]